MGDGFGFDRRVEWSLRLGGDIGWFVLMVSSGLPSGLEHAGHQILGSNSQGLLDPEHRENAKVGYHALENDGYEGNNSATSKVINALDFSPREIPMGSIYKGD
jgi:hypothetical protein